MIPIIKKGSKFRWTIENIEALSERSVQFLTEPVDWKIHVSTLLPETEDLKVSLFYDSGNKHAKNWFCEVNGEMKVMMLSGNEQPQIANFQSLIFEENIKTGVLTEWINVSKSSIANNALVIDLYINFHYYDFSKNIANFTDLIINIGNTKFYVNKGFLCAHSQYFYNLFVVEGSKHTELKIENVTPWSFCFLLVSPHSKFQIPLVRSYSNLIDLAKRFGVRSLHQKCEQFLILYCLPTIQKIKYADENDYNELMFSCADEHDYEELMKSCIESLKRTADVKKLQTDLKFLKLEESTKSRIVHRCLDFC